MTISASSRATASTLRSKNMQKEALILGLGDSPLPCLPSRAPPPPAGAATRPSGICTVHRGLGTPGAGGRMLPAGRSPGDAPGQGREGERQSRHHGTPSVSGLDCTLSSNETRLGKLRREAGGDWTRPSRGERAWLRAEGPWGPASHWPGHAPQSKPALLFRQRHLAVNRRTTPCGLTPFHTCLFHLLGR